MPALNLLLSLCMLNSVFSSQVYPKPRHNWGSGKCRLLINEIQPKNPLSAEFIELKVWCENSVEDQKAFPLDGHMLVIYKAGNPSTLIFSANLNGKVLAKDKFLTIGIEDNIGIGFKSSSVKHTNNPRNGIIPKTESGVYAVVLLYFDLRTRYAQNRFSLWKINGAFAEVPVRVGGQLLNDIHTHLGDIIIYGNPSVNPDTDFFKSILQAFQVESYINNYDENIVSLFQKSFNRCVSNSFPMQLVMLKCNPTPNDHNDCPLQALGILKPDPSPKLHVISTQSPEEHFGENQSANTSMEAGSEDILMEAESGGTLMEAVSENILTEAEYGNASMETSVSINEASTSALPETVYTPFSIGKLKSQAKKIVLNVLHFFQTLQLTPSLLSGAPKQMTIKATNICRMTLYRIIKDKKKDTVGSPKKCESRRKRVLDRIDSFYEDLIKRIIVEFYKENKPPLLNDIYTEFLSRVKDDEDEQERMYSIFGMRANTTQLPPLTCSLTSFRRKLEIMKYKFGKLNTRDAVLFREDILAWRGKYLRQMRENDARKSPWDVVYLDETWIDPHARLDKAWIPKNLSSNTERRLHTYRDHKVSRGGRLIVLYAGNQDGLIESSLVVRRVLKNSNAEDYHENINGDAFLDWFKQLLVGLESRSLIVIDNAPYHSVSTLPKQSDTKAKLLDWLKEKQKEDPDLKLPSGLRKWELWDIVKTFKKKSEYYQVDIEAARHGHEVVRLPPYNCELNPMEFVWAHVKKEIKKKNVKQNIKVVQDLAKRSLLDYPTQNWKNTIAHIKTLEKKYWDDDGHIDSSTISPIIIPLVDDESEDDDDGNDQTPYTSDNDSQLEEEDIEIGQVQIASESEMEEEEVEIGQMQITGERESEIEQGVEFGQVQSTNESEIDRNDPTLDMRDNDGVGDEEGAIGNQDCEDLENELPGCLWYTDLDPCDSDDSDGLVYEKDYPSPKRIKLSSTCKALQLSDSEWDD